MGRMDPKRSVSVLDWEFLLIMYGIVGLYSILADNGLEQALMD